MGLRLILAILQAVAFGAICLGMAYVLDPSPQNLEVIKVLVIGAVALVTIPILTWKLLPNLEGNTES